MASSQKLQLKFGTIDGVKTWNFNYAKTSPPVSQVKTLMNAMITNGSIYKYVPLEARSAAIVITTESYYDLDE